MELTSLDAQYFWANHPGAQEWCDAYFATKDDLPRTWVLDAVSAFTPRASTVLDMGCHCGPLLKRLTDAGFEAAGFDVNGIAVASARQRGLHAAVATAPAFLARFEDHSVDVVVSSYCLSYFTQPDVVTVLRECLRVARRGVVIAEPMAPPGMASLFHRSGQYIDWRHDYAGAIELARQKMPNDPMLRVQMTPHEPIDGINAILVAEWL